MEEVIKISEEDIKTFPSGCIGCKHFYFYDLSVDDYTNICAKNNWQVDDVDVPYKYRFQTECYEAAPNEIGF